MPQPQIIRKGGSVLGSVSIRRIHWREPVKGTVVVKDGTNAVLASDHVLFRFRTGASRNDIVRLCNLLPAFTSVPLVGTSIFTFRARVARADDLEF